MIKSEKKYHHWDYYLTIENDLINLSRYIDFSEENYNTFSIELVRILQIASSEFDVVCKLLCERLKSNGVYKNINDYRDQIKISIPNIVYENVYSKRHGLTLTPFDNWTGDKNPLWWTSYNEVKHYRNTEFNKANLKNVLNAVAGLYLVIIYYYLNGNIIDENNGNIKDLFFDIGNNSGESKFFTLKDDYYYTNILRS